MIDKSKIKVVKKTEVPAVKGKKKKGKRPTNAARQIVANVTDWVSDLKQRKRDETKAAIDMLFSSRPEPSNS